MVAVGVREGHVADPCVVVAAQQAHAVLDGVAAPMPSSAAIFVLLVRAAYPAAVVAKTKCWDIFR